MHDGLDFTAFYSIPVLLAIGKILGITAAASVLAILVGTVIRTWIKKESLRYSFSKVALFRWQGVSRWLALPTSLLVLSIVPCLVMSLMYLKIWGLQPIGTSFADFRMEIHQHYWVGADLEKHWSRLKGPSTRMHPALPNSTR